MAHINPTPAQLQGDGEPTVPRRAATVILVRAGQSSLEVLLVQRTHKARFVAGAWVFPGGAVDSADGTGDQALRAAGVRELSEEAGVTGVDPDNLVLFSRWVTPRAVKTRFDTHFFLAACPPDVSPVIDGIECVDLGWFTPAAALAASDREELLLVLPTVKHLEQLAGFTTVEALLDFARSREVQPLEPYLIERDGRQEVLLPGEPGYPPDG
jgi:8-oxo-dGTP pyrophosphatase MutT (NUDIX family)